MSYIKCHIQKFLSLLLLSQVWSVPNNKWYKEDPWNIQTLYYISESESVTQSCLTLCDLLDCNPPGSSVHGILQARILEWVVIPFTMGSSQSRDQIQVSCIAGRFFYHLSHQESLDLILEVFYFIYSTNIYQAHFTCQVLLKINVGLSPAHQKLTLKWQGEK